MCAYGLVDPVSKLAMKEAMRFAHNFPPEAMEDFFQKCTKDHDHQSVVGHCPGHGSHPLLSQAYPEMFCKAVAQVMHRTRHRQLKSKGNDKLRDDNVVQRAVRASPKGEIVSPDKMGTATGYITDIGRCKRYRLLTLVGLSINESHAALDSIKKKVHRKDPDSAKGRLDAYSARLRADMLAEHIVSGKGVIRVANFEGVNIQMALEGDEGIDYEYGDTYEATTARGCAVGAADEVRMPNGTWVMDTGCGHDLVGEKAIVGYPVEYMNEAEAPTFSER